MRLLSRTALVLLLAALSILPTAARPLAAIAVNPLLAQPYTLTFRVRQAGTVTIPAASLAAMGWPIATLDPHTIQVFRRGVEIPIEVNGEADDRFDPRDSIQLVVYPSESRYTTDAVYWLTFDAAVGLRVPLPANPTIPLHWEQDRIYQSVLSTGRGDRWFAGEIQAGQSPMTATLTLPASVPAGASLQLAVRALVRRANHQLTVRANGAPPRSMSWSDGPGAATPVTLTLALPNTLPAGALRLDIALTSAGLPTDDLLIDGIALPTVQVALPTLPTPTLTPVSSWDIRQGPAAEVTGADTLIITHSDFRPALDPLIAAKRAQVRAVAVIDVQAAYDTFSFGERDPEAIRSLIRTAAATWRPAPRSVLLVGAGTVRLRAGPNETDSTFIPPYLVDADPTYGEIGCDTCYTRLDADDVIDDPLPDIPIGRFPVHSLSEAQIVVAKTVTALTSPPAGAWRSQMITLTDNDRQVDGVPDPAGSFVTAAENAQALVPVGIAKQRFYYAPDQPTNRPYYQSTALFRNDLFAAWDAGAALVLYVGHASPWQWAATDPGASTPYLFSIYDTQRNNEGRLPIVISMTCLSGAWANPILQTTEERLILQAGGGDVASFGSSGSGVNTGHSSLLAGLLPTLFAGSGEHTLGAAHLAGLARVVATGRNLDLAYSFGILGDPDIVLPFVPRMTVFLPVVRR